MTDRMFNFLLSDRADELFSYGALYENRVTILQLLCRSGFYYPGLIATSHIGTLKQMSEQLANPGAVIGPE